MDIDIMIALFVGAFFGFLAGAFFILYALSQTARRLRKKFSEEELEEMRKGEEE